MKRKEIVSIVMAVYNGEKYLKEAIESVLQQSFSDFELIIINDGSTDSSEEIINNYLYDERIVYIKNEENLGLVSSLNRGIAISKGEYIARMDCDDMMNKDRLKIQYEFMCANSNVGVLGSNINIINSNSQVIGRWDFPNTNDELKRIMLRKCPFSHPTVMIRKAHLNSLDGPYRKKYPSSEDYDLWIRLHKITDFHSLPQQLLNYRLHDEQITSKKIKSVSYDTLKLITDSFIENKLSYKAIFFLYKPLFYILSPVWLIKLKTSLRDRKSKLLNV